jgi:hypothetical protein
MKLTFLVVTSIDQTVSPFFSLLLKRVHRWSVSQASWSKLDLRHSG